MLNSTVTTSPPGATVTLVSRATRLFTVTVTTTESLAFGSDPTDRDTVTLLATPAGILIVYRATGPPTASRVNVPLAALPLTADNTSLAGTTSRCPWLGGGEDEGEVAGEVDPDVDPDDGDAAGVAVLGWPGVALWLVVGVAASNDDVGVSVTVTVLRPGEDD